MKYENYAEAISDIYPGESIEVKFPAGFELEYEKWDGSLVKFECSKLSVYYWDEDDHKCIDRYYYDNSGGNWVCKQRSLTNESVKKVSEYCVKTPYPYSN